MLICKHCITFTNNQVAVFKYFIVEMDQGSSQLDQQNMESQDP